MTELLVLHKPNNHGGHLISTTSEIPNGQRAALKCDTRGNNSSISSNTSEHEDVISVKNLDSDEFIRSFLKIDIEAEESAATNPKIFPVVKSPTNGFAGTSFVRTLSFQNIIIGDESLKYLRPAAFDRERASYIKTIPCATVTNIRDFIVTTRFFGTRKVMFHVGEYELNFGDRQPKRVAESIKMLIVLTKTLIPKCHVYISLQFPVYGCCVSRELTWELNCYLVSFESLVLGVSIIRHDKIFLNPYGCFEDSYFLSQLKGTQLLAGNVKHAMKLHSINVQSNTTCSSSDVSKCPNVTSETQFPSSSTLSSESISSIQDMSNASTASSSASLPWISNSSDSIVVKPNHKSKRMNKKGIVKRQKADKSVGTA